MNGNAKRITNNNIMIIVTTTFGSETRVRTESITGETRRQAMEACKQYMRTFSSKLMGLPFLFRTVPWRSAGRVNWGAPSVAGAPSVGVGGVEGGLMRAMSLILGGRPPGGLT